MYWICQPDATASRSKTGRKVTVNNYSEHNGLTLPQLLAEMAALDQPVQRLDGYPGVPKRVFRKTKMVFDAWTRMLC